MQPPGFNKCEVCSSLVGAAHSGHDHVTHISAAQLRMASEVPRFFASLAERLGVEEVDVLLLKNLGIETCKDLASRLDSKIRLDAYIEDVARMKTAQLNEDHETIEVDDVVDPMESRQFAREARIGNLRRLWESSTTLAKKDLDDLVNITVN